jgi:dephospho-CoA kinase
VKRAIASRWPQVVGPDGEIVRDRVAQVVFADAGELAWLERLLHPRVVSTYLSWRRDLGDLPEPPAVCVTEVPLLYEVGGETRFDAVVVITASPEVRIARHLRPLQDRERRLIPDEEKARRADFAYVNDGTAEELDAFVSGVMEKLGLGRRT